MRFEPSFFEQALAMTGFIASMLLLIGIVMS
jgi:hypothetical protein